MSAHPSCDLSQRTCVPCGLRPELGVWRVVCKQRGRQRALRMGVIGAAATPPRPAHSGRGLRASQASLL